MLPGDLLVHGHKLTINDVSEQAMQNPLQQRIGSNRRATWLSSDLARPLRATWLSSDLAARPLPESLVPIVLWINRAVLHGLTFRHSISNET